MQNALMNRILFVTLHLILQNDAMRITVLQHDIAWMNPQESLQHLDTLMEQAPECDVCLLSEMFPTGFCTQPDEAAELYRLLYKLLAAE